MPLKKLIGLIDPGLDSKSIEQQTNDGMLMANNWDGSDRRITCQNCTFPLRLVKLEKNNYKAHEEMYKTFAARQVRSNIFMVVIIIILAVIIGFKTKTDMISQYKSISGNIESISNLISGTDSITLTRRINQLETEIDALKDQSTKPQKPKE